MSAFEYTAPTFTDNTGEAWTIVFDGPTLEKIANPETGLGFDISADDGTGLTKATSSGFMLGRVLWFLCEEQAMAKNISPHEFAKRLYPGEIVEGAEKALRQALLDFTPPRKRDALTKVLDAEEEMQASARREVIAKVTDPTTRERLLNVQRAHMESEIQKVEKALSQSGSSANDSPDTADAAQKESPTEP